MRHVCFFAGLALLVPAVVLAQAQGRVKGTVTDGEGQPIPDVTVTITCPEITTYRQEVKTDKRGIFATLIVDATKQYLFHLAKDGYQAIEQLHKPLIGGMTLELEFTLMSLQQAQEKAQQDALERPGYKELAEGRELMEAGETEAARDRFQAAVTAKADLHVAWHQLAVIDLEAGKPKQALEEVERCLEISPGFAPCLAVAVNTTQELGDEAAYDRYLAAYKLANPTDPAMLYNDVVPLLNEGKLDEAQPLLEEILEIDAEFPDALYQLAIIHINKGNYPEAKELLEKFVKVVPADHKDIGAAQGMLDWLKTQI